MTLGFSRGQDGKQFFSQNEPAAYFDWSGYTRRVHEELLGSEKWRAGIVEDCLPRGYAAGAILQGEAAANYAGDVREALIERGQDLFSRFTSAEWLWLIRNSDALAVCAAIPYLSPGSEIQVFRVAENLVGLSTNLNTTIGLGSSLESHALWTARLMSLAASIDRLENLIRRIAKGQLIRVLGKSLPTAVHDAAFERRITYYDDRRSSRAERWHPTELMTALGSDNALLAAFKFYGGWHKYEGWRGPLKDKVKTEIEGQFIARAWDFTKDGNLDRVSGSLLATANPQAAGSLLLLARALFQIIESNDLGAGEMIPKYGVLAIDNPTLRGALTDALSEAATSPSWSSFKDGLPTSVTGLEEHLWSFADPGRRSAYGSLLHTLPNDQRLVDLNALASHLGEDLRLLKGVSGPLVKLVSDKFEMAVQAIVDATRFAPSAATAALRGRQLKLDENYVTDIDAMLADGNTLLLISCKRIELGTDYDAGVHARVRAAQDLVNKATASWSQKTKTLRENRVGSNYDLSSFHDIVGIVITPELVFTNDASADELVDLPTLRVPRLTAVDELADILDGRTSRSAEFRSWLARRP